MYINYDANPSGSPTGDCVIRAIATITKRPWRDIHWDLAILSNQRYKMMDDNVIWHEYLKNLGFKIYAIQDPYMRIKDFCNSHPYGEYILGTGRHVVAVIDGNYYDAWDSGNEFPVFYWRKEN
jgi:hypothetical protein